MDRHGSEVSVAQEFTGATDQNGPSVQLRGHKNQGGISLPHPPRAQARVKGMGASGPSGSTLDPPAAAAPP